MIIFKSQKKGDKRG